MTHRGLYGVKQKEPMRHPGLSSELRLASRKIKRYHRQNGCSISLNFPRHTVARYFENNLAPYFTGELVRDFPFSYPPKNLG